MLEALRSIAIVSQMPSRVKKPKEIGIHVWRSGVSGSYYAME